jgi:hypothetical protein
MRRCPRYIVKVVMGGTLASEMCKCVRGTHVADNCVIVNVAPLLVAPLRGTLDVADNSVIVNVAPLLVYGTLRVTLVCPCTLV